MKIEISVMNSANASNDDLLNTNVNNSNQTVSGFRVERPSVLAVYAFVSWIASICVYVIFLVWTLTPEEYLHSLGITYYPNKHYAINLPVYALIGRYHCRLFKNFLPFMILNISQSSTSNRLVFPSCS